MMYAIFPLIVGVGLGAMPLRIGLAVVALIAAAFAVATYLTMTVPFESAAPFAFSAYLGVFVLTAFLAGFGLAAVARSLIRHPPRSRVSPQAPGWQKAIHGPPAIIWIAIITLGVANLAGMGLGLIIAVTLFLLRACVLDRAASHARS